MAVIKDDREEYDEQDDYLFNLNDYEEDDAKEALHRRRIRKLIEKRMERKKLKSEIKDLEDDFEWDDKY